MSCIQEQPQKECVQMLRKMARSDPRPSVRVTRGAGSGQHLASVLQERRENANIDAGLGFIWRISVQEAKDNQERRLGGRQLAFKPNLQIIRRSRRPLLRGLEQARRSALAHHVPRIAPMGARVLINGTRYKRFASMPLHGQSSGWPPPFNRYPGFPKRYSFFLFD